MKKPGESLSNGEDRMTPGELPAKWETQRMTNIVPLPEHLGERGVAVIRPGGRRGASRGRSRKRRGLNTIRKDRRVTGRGLKGGVTGKKKAFRVKAESCLAGKLHPQ